MSEESMIPYKDYINDALRHVIRDVLETTSKQGLPGEHHFYVTFATDHEDIQIPDHLLKQYPEKMTIIIQYQYSKLIVEDEGFNISLVFRSAPEPIYVPFDAILDFTDPVAQFHLQFDPFLEELEEGETVSIEPTAPAQSNRRPTTRDAKKTPIRRGRKPKEKRDTAAKVPDSESNENIISLDQFRKK